MATMILPCRDFTPFQFYQSFPQSTGSTTQDKATFYVCIYRCPSWKLESCSNPVRASANEHRTRKRHLMHSPGTPFIFFPLSPLLHFCRQWVPRCGIWSDEADKGGCLPSPRACKFHFGP